MHAYWTTVHAPSPRLPLALPPSQPAPAAAAGWGGKRKGAGRPPKAWRSSEAHKQRREHRPQYPVHVTVRVEREIGALRRRHAYHAIRRAMYVSLRRSDFRIVHIGIE